MGHPQWSPKVQMLRLQLIVYSTKEGDFQIQQEALVQEMDSR